MPLRRSRDHWVPGRDLHAVRHAPPAPSVEARPDRTPTAVVVGGGIAGLAAATGLAERGVAVTLVEAAPTLGGRVRAWPVAADGTSTTMSRGFHAFFRQYYNLRSLLRRSDPTMARLRPVADYPLVLAGGHDRLFRRTCRPGRRSTSWRSWRAAPASPSATSPASTSTRPSGCSTSRSRGPTTTTPDVAPRSSSTGSGSLTGRGISRSRCSRASFFADPRDFSGASWSRCSTPTSWDRPRGCSSTSPTTTTTRPCGRRWAATWTTSGCGWSCRWPRRRWRTAAAPWPCGSRTGRRSRPTPWCWRPTRRRCSDSLLTRPGWATRRGVRGWRPVGRRRRSRSGGCGSTDRCARARRRSSRRVASARSTTSRRSTSSRRERGGGRGAGTAASSRCTRTRCPTAPTRARSGSSCATGCATCTPSSTRRTSSTRSGWSAPTARWSGPSRGGIGPRSARRTRGSRSPATGSAATTRSR